MKIKILCLGALTVLPALCGDWSPRLAADYLDGRQKEWSVWKNSTTTAGSPGAPCMSCHTGIGYLLVRPGLRRVLGEGEGQPTSYEQGLVGGLRARVDWTDPLKFSKNERAPRFLSAESIFASLFLTLDKPGSADSERAFNRMWSLQIQDGKDKGAWPWLITFGDPWSSPEATFYGATLAALAVGNAPAEYRRRAEVREHVASLVSYFQAELPNQPLHNRLSLLWASTKWPEVLPDHARHSLIAETLKKQEADGGWTMASLGPWKEHPDAPPASGSNSYATGFTAFMLQKAGVKPSDPAMARALAWLRSHQDRQAGYWAADSMNKKYPPDTMLVQFTRDAATEYAALALLEAGDTGK
jgi:squalene-hopene/tetraprenyl-beta-curcumene cyclase